MTSLNDIEVECVSRRTLDSVSFACRLNEVSAIIGPSGCGKSTLLRMMAGVEDPDEGRILLRGKTPESWRKKGSIGLAFQKPTLLPWRSVRENIRLPLDLMGRRDGDAVDQVLDLTRLSEYSERLPSELSGGQAQRTALARALVTRPSYLLLDEPFASLDVLLREKLNVDLLGWLHGMEVTTVLVTHDPREAAFLASRVIVLSDAPSSHVILEQVLCKPSDCGDTGGEALQASVRNAFKSALEKSDAITRQAESL